MMGILICVINAISQVTGDVNVLSGPVIGLEKAWSAPKTSSVRFAGVRNAQNVDGINAFPSKCSISGENENLNVVPTTIPDADYTPFVSDGYVSLVGDSSRVPVRILRDTGASERFIRQSLLPFSSASDTDSVVLIRGIRFPYRCIGLN